MSAPTDLPPDDPESWFTNEATIFPSNLRDITSELAARLQTECDALHTHFARALPDPGAVMARLALLGTADLQTCELKATPDEFICVGRHTEATLRAPNAESLSLRHVLLIPYSGDPGTARLDIVSLAPTVRLAPWRAELPGDLAESCNAVVLGDALLLLALTTSSTTQAELNYAPAVAAHLERGARRVRVSETNTEPLHTRITTAYSVLDLPETHSGDAPLVLEVRSGETRIHVALREEWLAQGIILGRNHNKCSHAALSKVLLNEGVSRCHMFCRREAESLVFYDTASTSGVWVDDRQVHRFEMPAPRAVLKQGVGVQERQAAVNPARIRLALTEDVSVTLFAK